MLGKKYSLGSIVEETGEARIKLANFDELKTQSDDVASFLNTFSPDSGFVYLHVIAMGEVNTMAVTLMVTISLNVT